MENLTKAGETNNVEVTASSGIGEVVNSGQTEITATVNQEKNEGVDGGSLGNDDNSSTKSESQSKKQDSATNKVFADFRRRYEKKLKDAEKEKEAAVKAKEVEMVKMMYKTNQWTGKAIEDEYDVEEFLAMQKLADEGLDPITAYSEQIKQSKRTAANDARAKADEESLKQTRATTYLNEFREKYKDVSVTELLADKDFMEFGAEALEVMPLVKVYEAYISLKGKMAEQKKADVLAANSSVAVGSVTSATESADNTYFTREQVLKMSKTEISKNYDKIRASQEKW